MHPTSIVLLLVLSATGCTRLGFEALPGGGDDQLPIADGPAKATDGTVDARLDGAGPDTPRDGPAPEAVLVGDVGVKPKDFFTKDVVQPKEGPSPTACSSPAKQVFAYPGNNMVICQLTSSPVDQCSLGKLCSAINGWAACTASEFLARGGTSTPGQPKAWIAGCARNAATPVKPTDGPCSACLQLQVADVAVTWPCSSGLAIFSDLGVLGVTTATVCHRVGLNTASAAAYWDILGSEQSLDATVCCK